MIKEKCQEVWQTPRFLNKTFPPKIFWGRLDQSSSRILKNLFSKVLKIAINNELRQQKARFKPPQHQYDNSDTSAAQTKWWKYNFAGHEVLTQYILAVMEKPMPPSSMSYRHLVHRNSTKEVFKKNCHWDPDIIQTGDTSTGISNGTFSRKLY